VVYDIDNTNKEIIYLLSSGVKVCDIGRFVFKSISCIESRLCKLRLLTNANTNCQMIAKIMNKSEDVYSNSFFKYIKKEKYNSNIKEYFNDLKNVA
jgi:hypothetical protein